MKNTWRTWCSACIDSLLEDRHLREVDLEPLLLELPDGSVLRQLRDRPVDDRRQLRALLQHGAVLLVRDELAGDRAERSRLRLRLEQDEWHVEDDGLAAVQLHRLVERRGRREDERLLGRLQLILDELQT